MDVRLTEQVHKMAVFIAVWHAPNFLKCSLAVTAPANDLSFFQDMLRLSESEDPDFARIGDQVAESVQRHTSYLKAPQVVFALFDEKSGVKERKDIASALSAIPRLDSSSSLFKLASWLKYLWFAPRRSVWDPHSGQMRMGTSILRRLLLIWCPASPICCSTFFTLRISLGWMHLLDSGPAFQAF